MHWISVEDQAPPKDRVIMVTNGMLWDYKDNYFERDNYTSRTWNARGGIYLVIWYDFDSRWILADGSALFTPEIKFWAEYENPIRDNTPFTQTNIPQGTLAERWEGRYDRATVEREIKAAEREVAKRANWREIDPNLEPNVLARVKRNHADPRHVDAMERLLKLAQDKLDVLLMLREVSEYPDNQPAGHPFDE